MSELVLARHGQASFGSDDYDRLSPLGHEQARRLGDELAASGFSPDCIFIGAQRRHRETLEGMAPTLKLDPAQATVLEGLNEFDVTGLLNARFPDGLTHEERNDRGLYFRLMREMVIAWQNDEIDGPPELFSAFTERVLSARSTMISKGGTVLVVSSGGAISRMLADVMQAPPVQMILLQLQLKNCVVSRLVGRDDIQYLHSFNETPHLQGQV
ncbi:histidine phosphatase family protein [Breoghania sp.]|uniref:histidine phosphatase family protein n=1 Tax=Breoghania sp. TaxID=2065378 RepID=UPI0026209DD3|nr:histidine phosphatase family protein [Breoghania sp.]MDJ0930691.1 histidine phosphatase family protein [Breoghania sp.]